MKTSNIKWFALLVAALVCFALPAPAKLVAVVHPGYQFPLDGSVVPSYDLLNLGFLPTVDITGTFDGSNSISPGSITGVSLSDSLPDGVTIGWNGAVPRQLGVIMAGITNMADANVAGGAAIQMSKLQVFSNSVPFGAPTNAGVSLVFDSNFKITVSTNRFPGYTNVGYTLGLANTVVSNLVTVVGPNLAGLGSAGLVIDTAHGYTNTPSYYNWVLICTNSTSQNGFRVGDKVPILSLLSSTVLGTGYILLGGANSTNVYLIRNNTGSGWQLSRPDTGAPFNLTDTRWVVGCDVRP